MVAAPLGAAADAAWSESRWMSHSDLQPTGRFIRAGETLVVSVAGDHVPTAARVVIGLIGPYDEHNSGQEVTLEHFRVDALRVSITAPHDGMVFSVNLATDRSATLTLAGGTPVPTWIKGRTTRAEFEAQVARYSAAPFFELIADRIFGDFQSDAVGDAILSDDVDVTLGRWDTLVGLTDSVYGMSRTAEGVNHRGGHRIDISNPDSGWGYASASSDRIEFQNNTNAGIDLFSGELGQWGLWHEIGHTYQTPQYLWSGVEEVTVNISTLAIQEELMGANRLDEAISEAEAFFAIPREERDFMTVPGDDAVWVKLLMFDQLRRAYGDAFYPRLSQYFREQRAQQMQEPLTDEEKMQAFIVATSTVVQRDLAPFFAEWGLRALPETVERLRGLPQPSAPIWENVSTEKVIIDFVLGAAAPEEQPNPAPPEEPGAEFPPDEPGATPPVGGGAAPPARAESAPPAARALALTGRDVQPGGLVALLLVLGSAAAVVATRLRALHRSEERGKADITGSL